MSQSTRRAVAEKTADAVKRAAELYWSGEPWATIANVLRAEGLADRNPNTVRQLRIEHPELWAKYSDAPRRTMREDALRLASYTLSSLLNYTSEALYGERVEAVIESGDLRKLYGIIALADARRRDHELRVRGGSALLSNLARREMDNPADPELPLTEEEMQQEIERIIDEDPNVARLFARAEKKAKAKAKPKTKRKRRASGG